MNRSQVLEILESARRTFAVWVLVGMAWLSSAPAHAGSLAPVGSAWFWMVGLPAACWMIGTTAHVLAARRPLRRVQALRIR